MTDRDSVFDDDPHTRRADDAEAWRRRWRAVWRWLKARPVESWVFFGAGMLAGGVFL